MPQPVTDPRAPPGLRGAAVGFCGKLPARGDFVVSGLPRRFVEPWHDWLQRVLSASRDLLGEEWLPAWLEAPIWRFALSPGLCGPDAALGVWMPSVDRIGRHFPLTLAAVAPGCDPASLLRDGEEFLMAAEAAGLDALSCDLSPGELLDRVAAAASLRPNDPVAAARDCPPDGAVWWSEGSPRVSASTVTTTRLPDAATFAAMLDARAATGEPCR